MNNRHPWQLKRSKSWEAFWSYHLNSTPNLANLAQFWGKWALLAVLFSFFFFSIFLGAEYLSYVKSIATFALTFFGYIISVLANVYCTLQEIFPTIPIQLRSFQEAGHQKKRRLLLIFSPTAAVLKSTRAWFISQNLFSPLNFRVGQVPITTSSVF